MNSRSITEDELVEENKIFWYRITEISTQSENENPYSSKEFEL